MYSSSSTRHVAFAPTSPSPSTLPFPSSAPATTEEPLSSLKDSLRVRLDSDTRQRERRLSGETIAAPNKLRKKRPEEQKRERRASETSTEPSVHEEDEVVPEVAMVEEEQPTDESALRLLSQSTLVDS